MQHTPCNMQHTPCNMQHTPCRYWHSAYFAVLMFQSNDVFATASNGQSMRTVHSGSSLALATPGLCHTPAWPATYKCA